MAFQPMHKWVFKFGSISDGDKTMKQTLGGKGANLAEMAALGMPVPPGFTITTEACKYVVENGGAFPEGMERQVDEALAFLEKEMGSKFGEVAAGGVPLLLSVRSGAAVSMPGMMDTVLNLGLNDDTAEAMAAATGNRRFVMDSYRRYVYMHGEVVRGMRHAVFEREMDALKEEVGAEGDLDLTADHLATLVQRFKAVYRREVGEAFPDSPRQQLLQAVSAVFGSWNTERAVAYRKINGIHGLLGTAVNVQCMVYGNMGPGSGTGVLFTRHPSTGENALFGEYLENAQGEDVVAGIRTPVPIARLQDLQPEVYAQLLSHVRRLERHLKNVQDCEFTVQEGRLFLLQTRDGKRTGAAALRIAVEMVEEGIVSRADAVERLVTPAHVEQLLHPRFRDEQGYRKRGAVLTTGLGASPGAAVGRAVFTAEAALEAAAEGDPVILVRAETSPEDVRGMHAAAGVLTQCGGMTSHAAVVARGWGKPCVCGASDIRVNDGSGSDGDRGSFSVGDLVVNAGDWLSLQGSTGEVILGREETVAPEMCGHMSTFASWVSAIGSSMAVRANADTPEDVATAVSLGAVGVGLVRTEHMFFADDRVWWVRQMILADSSEQRQAALHQLFLTQRADFEGIFRALEGRPVTIRLLDPPLHEFLPRDGAQQQRMAEQLGVSAEEVERRVEALCEVNPMLGHRGCRLGITRPEITEMQVRALMEAAVNVAREFASGAAPGGEGKEEMAAAAKGGATCVAPVEIMVPLVVTQAELRHQKAVIEAVANAVVEKADEEALASGEQRSGVTFNVGTMIETPRAALTAEDLAPAAAFFSFGTNDLTQMTFGFSRDDIARFLPHYLELGILRDDPFTTIDQHGVGALVQTAVRKARSVDAAFKVGVCGEHGGDARSAEFFYATGLDYVSCSPFRVPVAKLASAQAHIRAVRANKAAAAEAAAHSSEGECTPSSASSGSSTPRRFLLEAKVASTEKAL